MRHFLGVVETDSWTFPSFITHLAILAFEAIPSLKLKFTEDVRRAERECPRICKLKFRPFTIKGFPLSELYETLGLTKDIHSVLAPSVDEQVLMARIVSVEDEESYIEDVVADTWKKRLIDERKPILWKELFNMDVATRIEEERVQAAATENVALIGLMEHIQSLKKTMYDGFLQIGASIDDIDKRLKSVDEFMKETRGEGQQQESYQWAEKPNQSTQ